MSDDQNNRRFPKDLKGLLQFALNQTRSEDAPNPSAYQEMDPERRSFLDNAFKSMTIDIIKQFEQTLVTLYDDKASIDEKEAALTHIRDHICQVDFANSFAKLGGDQMLMDYAKHSSIRLRRLALSIIAEMSQSNPPCQKMYLDDGAVELCVTYFLESAELARAALYAVSAIIRCFKPALQRFVEIGGVHALSVCLKRNDEKVFIKAAFLLAATAREMPELKDRYVDEGVLNYLISCLDPVRDYDTKIETCLCTMSLLIHSERFAPSQEAKETLKQVIRQIIQDCGELPQCQEMVDYAKTVLDALLLLEDRQRNARSSAQDAEKRKNLALLPTGK